MVQPEPEGFVVLMDIKEFCHPELMASIRVARSLPYGLGQVSQQLPWPEQPAAEQQGIRTGTQDEASIHHPECISRPGTDYQS